MSMKTWVCSCILLVTMLSQAQGGAITFEIPKFPNIDSAVETYAKIKEVKPSTIGSKEFLTIIKNRCTCYSKSSTPLHRKASCNIKYVDNIVSTARNKLESVPQLGLFIRMVQYCPISYSMCIGEHMDSNQCMTVELQCIYFALDTFWRGSPPKGTRD